MPKTYQNRSNSRRHGSVYNVGVPCDPTAVSRAPVNISGWLKVEYVLARGIRIQLVTGLRVHNTFRLACAPAEMFIQLIKLY